MKEERISVQTRRRLPQYLGYLRTLPVEAAYVSAPQIAEALGFGEVAVRKDLAAACGVGRPRTGYPVQRLTADIRHLLVREKTVCFAIVGMGRLGRALAGYQGFEEYGLRLTAVFDSDESLWGIPLGALSVQPAEEVAKTCQTKNIGIGVIAVPTDEAQAACDALVAGGIRVIWNFAPAHLTAPPEVVVEHENMAASLGLLSRHLAGKV